MPAWLHGVARAAAHLPAVGRVAGTYERLRPYVPFASASGPAPRREKPLTDSRLATRLASPTWSDTTELFCPNGVVQFGAIWPNSTSAGQTVQGAFCLPGWSGFVSRQCNYDGTWSPTVLGSCTRTSAPWHLMAHGHGLMAQLTPRTALLSCCLLPPSSPAVFSRPLLPPSITPSSPALFSSCAQPMQSNSARTWSRTTPTGRRRPLLPPL